MPLPLAFPLAAAVSLLTGLATASQASDWGDVVAVSSTMGVHDGRICVGEATRGDIGCPAYAPQVATDGSISASAFVGDGSALTGVVASTADRIVSGTTSLLAVSSTGFVSLTQAGTNTGWFDPTRGLVTLGVSSTGTISGTTGYFSGNVGFGNMYPATAIETAGVIHVRDPGTLADNNYKGALRITRPTSAAQYINMVKSGTAAWSLGMTYGTANFAIGQGAFTDSSFTNPFFVITNIGRVGIGTVTPAANLEVSGTVSATNLMSGRAWINQGLTLSGTAPVLSPIGISGTTLMVVGTQGNPPLIQLRDGVSAMDWAFWMDNNKLRLSRDSSTSALMTFDGPGVGIGTLSPTAPLEVSGTVSATRFVGDGSQLTGLVASTVDRIVSGTTSLLAVSSTGFVSLTQAGTNTGWFDPARGLVTLGVSSTGAISTTRGYFSGNVAIGSSTLPGINHRELFLYTDGPATSALTGNADLRVQSQNRNAFLTLIGGGMGVYFHPSYSYGTASQNPGFLLYTGTTNPYMKLGVSNTEIMRLTSSSNVGIGTTAPTTRLEVNGTVSATYVKLADNDDKPCAPENNGTIRFFNGRISLCRVH